MILLQSLLSVAAGGSLFWLWRRFVLPHPLGRLVTAGFLFRAVAAQVLFWISFLRMPVASSLQREPGLWFFADDASVYLELAGRAAAEGLPAILACSRNLPSVNYVQALALASMLLGSSVSTGFVLNLFAYLLSCLVVLRWSSVAVSGTLGPALTLAALSFSPSAVLWSTQPLKDTLFQALVVLVVGGAFLWQRAWSAGLSGRGVAAAGLCAAGLFGLAGIRWYFATIVVIAFLPFLALVAMQSRRRAWAWLAACGFVLVLSRALLWGGGSYLPPQLASALRHVTLAGSLDASDKLIAKLQSAREGFDRSGGATAIRLVHRRGSTPADLSLASAENPGPTGPPSRAEERAAPARVAMVPSSAGGRLAAGTAALFVPRSALDRVGWVEIRGGRGLFWFTDLDTLVFDGLVGLVLVMAVRRRRSARRQPLVWFLAVMAAAIAILMAYTVSNFGTLFRLRSMAFIGIALLPLAFASGATIGKEDRDA